MNLNFIFKHYYKFIFLIFLSILPIYFIIGDKTYQVTNDLKNYKNCSELNYEDSLILKMILFLHLK